MESGTLIKYFGNDLYSDLLEFYKKDTLEEFVKQEVPIHNIKIALGYLRDIRRKGVAQTTIKNNVYFMNWLLFRFKKDFDKITEEDRDDIIDQIDFWKAYNNKPAKESSKKIHKVAFKRFLSKYGDKIHNKALKELADFEINYSNTKRKLPEDLLTEEEIRKLIVNADNVRDKALIAILYESGARRGEIVNCKLKDVTEFHKGSEHGYRLKLKGKTGERQVIIYRYQQWLRAWLAVCPSNDPNTPLFPTTRMYSESSYSEDEEKRKQAKNEPRDFSELQGYRINEILRTAAKKAGIKKNVHAHALRHAQATRLANTMTEQQLKTQFGWTRGSNMTEVYIHLSGKDTETAILRSYGIVIEEDEKGNKVEHCAQCDEVLSPGFIHCPKCGLPLTQEAKEAKDNMDDLISSFVSNPEIQKIFFENLQKQNKK
jgi:integrase/recombinase XerD